MVIMNKSLIIAIFIIPAIIVTSVYFLHLKQNNSSGYKTSTNSETSKEQTDSISYKKLAQKYVPQNTPEASFKLELKLLNQGIYCYDLPLFDPTWRKKGKQILFNSGYKHTAKKFNISFKTYSKEQYAIIYFPYNKSVGPEFFYKESFGWVIDRTAVWNYIHYNYSNTGWFAYEGDYPYLNMLKENFSLKKIKLDNGVWAYRIKS